MTKEETIQAAKDKQKLNEARRLYLHFRQLNKLTDELQRRFQLFPVLDEIQITKP
jgi:hypothetical protein